MSKKKIRPPWDNGEIGAHDPDHRGSILDEDLKRRSHLREQGRKPKKEISCETAKRYIRFVFASMAKDFINKTPEEKRRHDKALNHMRSFKNGGSVVTCQECLDYYEMKKRKHCVG